LSNFTQQGGNAGDMKRGNEQGGGKPVKGIIGIGKGPKMESQNNQ